MVDMNRDIMNDPKKKRCRLGPRYQMEINFADEDQKKVFLSRLDSARGLLSSCGSRGVDNYKLLSTLLDHFEAEHNRVADVGEVAPSASIPRQKRPMLNHSGISFSYEMCFIIGLSYRDLHW